MPADRVTLEVPETGSGPAWPRQSRRGIAAARRTFSRIARARSACRAATTLSCRARPTAIPSPARRLLADLSSGVSPAARSWEMLRDRLSRPCASALRRGAGNDRARSRAKLVREREHPRRPQLGDGANTRQPSPHDYLAPSATRLAELVILRGSWRGGVGDRHSTTDPRKTVLLLAGRASS
jgi:hypothetical protein